MLQNIPYSKMLENEINYKIMLTRDVNAKSFVNIAKELGISQSGVCQKYDVAKIMQIKLYMLHLSLVFGYDDTHCFKKEILDCFENKTYAVVYWENKYTDILSDYHSGEPGIQENWGIYHLKPHGIK